MIDMKEKAMSHSIFRITAVALAAILATACGDGTDPNSDGTGLSGTIRIDGSSTVGPLSEAAAELFMNDYPGVRVTVAMSGTSGGFQKFCIGENDMNDASRPIKESEIALCAENGIGWDGIQVANDALSLLVNSDNPLQCITVEQANQIWDFESAVHTWGDIDGLDIPADMASQVITLYGPGTDSGTFDFFTEVINGEEGVIRIDYIDIGEDDHLAVTAVEGDIYAMGYVPYSYFQEAGDRVKALDIDNGNGCVAATLANVQYGSYTPLGRPLFVYASDTALAKPEVLEFMTYYVTNAERIAQAAAFVPMTPAQIAEQLARVQALVSGS
jgi:phosphate transport system substrate-binding protein